MTMSDRSNGSGSGIDSAKDQASHQSADHGSGNHGSSVESQNSGDQAQTSPKDTIRDQFIPIGRADLIDSLPGLSSCTQQDQQKLRQLFRVLDSHLHHQYHSQHTQLQKVYQSLDPDCEFQFNETTSGRCNENSRMVFERLQFLLEKANYRKLTRDDLESAVENASVLGIRLQVNFDLFEELHIYARGNRVEKWTKRTWWKLFREEEFDVDVYQRLVIAFRLKEDKWLSKDHRPNVVYLKSFKSIPHSDMHALLPGTRVKMSLLDQGKIILPTLSGLAISLFKLFRFLVAMTLFATLIKLFYFFGILIGIALYVAKGFFSYVQTKDKYLLNLTRHLYFQNLDNNGGVLLRVLNEAESQDYRELIYGYYILWRFGKRQGLTLEELDEITETNLRRMTRLDIDFEVTDAVDKLKALGLVDTRGDKLIARDIDQALSRLDFQWDSIFTYHWPEKNAGES